MNSQHAAGNALPKELFSPRASFAITRRHLEHVTLTTPCTVCYSRQLDRINCSDVGYRRRENTKSTRRYQNISRPDL
jgi:hypothetical protein